MAQLIISEWLEFAEWYIMIAELEKQWPVNAKLLERHYVNRNPIVVQTRRQ